MSNEFDAEELAMFAEPRSMTVEQLQAAVKHLRDRCKRYETRERRVLRAVQDEAQLADNLTAVQARCTELLAENRELKKRLGESGEVQRHTPLSAESESRLTESNTRHWWLWGWRRIDEDRALASPFGCIRKCDDCGALVATDAALPDWSCLSCRNAKRDDE